MASFKDNAGNVWTVALNIATIRRVRNSPLKIDLLSKDLPTLIERIFDDLVLMVDLVYVILKPELDAKEITDEQFGAALAGDALEGAALALLEALSDFCPNPRDRARVKRLMEKLLEAAEKARDRADAAMEKLEIHLMQEATGGDLSSSKPASSESIPEA